MKAISCVLVMLVCLSISNVDATQKSGRAKSEAAASTTTQAETKQSDSKADKQAELEAAFAEKLTNAVMTGNFTVVGRDEGKPPKPERYEISSAKKLAGNTWLITSRIKYGKVDATVPIPVYVLWAGDTPMISLTDITIPGMNGKFSCRVLFHGDRYAGTWQHDANGGHMWGTIEKQKKEESSEAK